MILCEDLSKIYTLGAVQVHALRDVSLTIEKGEFIGIMGSSGSGKSTLLHMLGLLDHPSRGSITLAGTDVGTLTEDERTLFRLNNLGYVFQDYALISELSVLENVCLPCLVRGTPRGECIPASTEILSSVGLGDRINHLYHELSGGQQQRVSIARALVNKPRILFADEPCANLDSETSRNILELFRQLNQELKQTIVMVSHEPWHTEYFDRVITLRDGEVVAS
ncbi:ABC transporter ATP-binding protein [Methanoregula sp.]|uniref:ABC transporter ATP-binding protein n=1 Tax=Methanoregula sp. TaxID=2052170 RepID=UPI003561CAD8